MIALFLALQAAAPTVPPAEPSTAAATVDFPAATIDTNSDGTPDAWDLNGDGKADVFDTTGDGKPDRADRDGDGTAESAVRLRPRDDSLLPDPAEPAPDMAPPPSRPDGTRTDAPDEPSPGTGTA